MKTVLRTILLGACIVFPIRSIAEEKRNLIGEVEQAISDIQEMAQRRESNDAQLVELRNQVDELKRFDADLRNELMDGFADVESSTAEGAFALGRNDRRGAGNSAREAANSFVDTYTSAIGAAGNELTARDLEGKIARLERSNRDISRSIANSLGALIAVGPIAMSGASAPVATNSVFTRVSAVYARMEAVASAREAQRGRERVDREQREREDRPGKRDFGVPRTEVDLDPEGEMTIENE